MADDAFSSPADNGFSPNSGTEITMEEGSENSQELQDDEGEEDFEIGTGNLDNEDTRVLEIKSGDIEDAVHQVIGIESFDNGNDSEKVLDIHDASLETENEHVIEFDNNDNPETTDDASDCTQGESYPAPVKGMEFDSYDDAYNFYNCYAKELGFGIRVKSSWTKRNSKEKRGAVLCCYCEGFKPMKEVNTRRKETRTRCLAMIRLRLLESNRWRLDEVKLQHNHLYDHQRAQRSRSHKKMEAGAKRKLESAVDLEVQTIKLYRPPAIDSVSCGSSNERELGNHVDQLKLLKFRNGDLEALDNYFRRAQLADPNFFYIMDLNDEGYLRNVFWIESRWRTSYVYFGDVVVVDATCVSSKNDNIPILSFSGLNHHCRSLLLGCGLIVDESIETYIWLMRAWLTCMSGRPPQTVITNRCKSLQCAISEVFPRTYHRFCSSLVVENIYENLGEVGELEVFRTVLNRTVFASMKIEEFEMGWEKMIQHFAFKDHDWLRNLYEDRERWVPVYLKKNSFLAGIHTDPYFDGHLHNQKIWDEFFNTYELIMQKKIRKEALDDHESRDFTPLLRTTCSYEFPASLLYTKEIFLKFQEEVVLMSSCFSVTQIHANGSIVTYMVRERGHAEVELENFEVVYDRVGIEVCCNCGCFDLRGYLCRHALTVLNYHAIEGIPDRYILSRWRKDIKRSYCRDFGSSSIDISNPVQCHEHLYRRALQIVMEGMSSEDHRTAAWQAFKESLDRVRLAAPEKRV
ncbi:hypothetical protein OROHE_022127 [Orobanche hederae]